MIAFGFAKPTRNKIWLSLQGISCQHILTKTAIILPRSTMDPSFPLSPILNLLFAILVTLLLPWRFRALSTAVRMYILWIALSCICRAVNSTVWRNNVNDVAPVWCDICTLFFHGSRLLHLHVCQQRQESLLAHQLHTPHAHLPSYVVSITQRASNRLQQHVLR